MLSAPLMPYLLVGMCFKNLSVLITEQTGQLLNAQFIDQLLLNQWDYSSWRLQMRTQEEEFAVTKETVNFMCIYPFSHQTPMCGVRGRQKRLKYTQDRGGGFIIMKGILKG